MGIIDINDHTQCFHYDRSEKPLIQVVKLVKGAKKKLTPTSNEIVFIIEGRVKYLFRELPTVNAIKGQIIFRPAGVGYGYETQTRVVAVILRVIDPIMLCPNFQIEKLYGMKAMEPAGESGPSEEREHIGLLEINSRLWYFITGVMDCVADGLHCRCWAEMKIKEFFYLLRVYYPKDQLRDFFTLILSEDTSFSEYVRGNWLRLYSVQQMATSLHMTRKQFTLRFIKIFGENPSQWMTRHRARKVYAEIASTNSPLKHIAQENAFSDDSQLTRFCKKQFGKTPSEIRLESTGENKSRKGQIQPTPQRENVCIFAPGRKLNFWRYRASEF